MDLFPAIDIRGGRCVRLHQGDYGRETVYGDDPVAQAVAFVEAGAGWIHVVDLDAARTGIPENRDVVAAIAEAVDVPVQTGGGIRSVEAASVLFDAGVERVVIGTAAIKDLDLVRSLARDHRVAVGLDARAGEVATDGWLVGSGRTVLDVARSFADVGVDAFIVTDISRDGTLEGPDIGGLIEVLGATSVDVIASGGVGTPNDLRELAAVEVDGRRLAGVIAGKAIYEGHVDVAEAVMLLRGGS
ncbi:MAG: 1-(5-phosphoribosyl)-5-[(5-phosphoribosylamino)methylideneamino]imidazole-4-carboxamide isomerase [Acidimicrobiales bacterium]|jgi:phosphoribosylformimino-5-aminoimidazole carboxamide ribotide isomerase